MRIFIKLKSERAPLLLTSEWYSNRIQAYNSVGTIILFYLQVWSCHSIPCSYICSGYYLNFISTHRISGRYTMKPHETITFPPLSQSPEGILSDFSQSVSDGIYDFCVFRVAHTYREEIYGFTLS